MKQQAEVTYVGIDVSPAVGGVSKASLDIGVIPSGESWSVSTQENDIAALAKKLRRLKPEVIVLEPTTRPESRSMRGYPAAVSFRTMP